MRGVRVVEASSAEGRIKAVVEGRTGFVHAAPC